MCSTARFIFCNGLWVNAVILCCSTSLTGLDRAAVQY